MICFEPKVSVVLTCYNYGNYILSAIESVLSQTYQDFEIIIINDGSTDNTDELVKKYIHNEKIKYFKQKNAGQANAKNAGIKNAAGNFIAFLDADDLWKKHKFEKQLPYFSDPKVGVVYSGLSYMDEFGKDISFNVSSKHLIPRSGNVSKHLFLDNFVPFSSSIVRKECFDKVGLFDESLKMGIDWDLWLRMSVHFKFDFVNEPLMIYRKGHSEQMSKNYEVRKDCSERIMRQFFQDNPTLLSKSLIREAFAYTYCNRGYHYRLIDPKNALRSYLSALKWNWHYSKGYSGIVKCLLLNYLFKNTKNKKLTD